MGKNALAGSLKGDLEKVCKKVVDKVKKTAPGEKNEKKLGDLMNKHVCKEIDQKLLKTLAEQISKQAKKKSAKAVPGTPPKVDAKPTMKKPGSGAPSLTLPLADFDILGDKKKDSKVELQIWGDPRELEKTEKGAMLYFTVTF